MDVRPTSISAVMIDNLRWVRAAGQLDIATRAELERAICGDASTDARTVYVDLAEVDFIDAAAIGGIVHAAKHLTARGSALKIIGATGMVAILLKITGISAAYEAKLPEAEAEALRDRSAGPGTGS